MVSLCQLRKVRELEIQDYVIIENPDYEGLDKFYRPINGPSTLRAPNGDLVQIFADGVVRMFIPKTGGNIET